MIDGTCVSDRRTAGRLSRQHPAHARAREGAAQGLDRSVEPRLSERQRLRSAVRVARPGGALVRLLAQGSRTGVRKILASSFISSSGIRPGRDRKTSPANGAPRVGRRRDWFRPRSYLQPDHRLAARTRRPGAMQLRYVPSTGVEAGFWWGELLTDQRPVDAFSLTYDSPALEEPWRFSACRASCCGYRATRRSRTGSYACPT